jgi:ElaB/YqjD/DUF883 family membrane-anchored ribosome-binding protein
MNTNSPQQPFVSQLHDEARQAAQTATTTAKDAASQASQATKDAFNNASDTAKDAYQTARSKAEETYQTVRAKAEDTYDVVRAKADETYRTVRAKADETAVATGQYVRQHPMPSVLGAVAIGVGLGYLLALSARRPQPSFREQYVDEPLDAAREALYAVLAPVAHRIRSGYESARDGAEKTYDRAQHFDGSHAAHSLADQLRRVGGNLKFW